MSQAEVIDRVSLDAVSLTTTYSVSQTIQAAIEGRVEHIIQELLSSLPDPETLTAEQRRGIIARYSSVLEGNFIYWMTGAYIASGSEPARSIILENLNEEVRGSHPVMLRKFTIAAQAAPTELDAAAVYRDLTKVRLFVSQLSGVRTVLMMAFFEGFIQKFMAFLADIAHRQGSEEMEYTDVHGVCDVTHTEGLFRALSAEMELDPPEMATDLFEGVALLYSLIQTILDPTAVNKRLHSACQTALALAS